MAGANREPPGAGPVGVVEHLEDRAGSARIDEIDEDLTVFDPEVGGQSVGQGTRRPLRALLSRRRLDHWHIEVRRGERSLDPLQIVGRRRQGQAGPVAVRVGEVESRAQVAADRPPPVADLRLHHAKTLLKELQGGSVVEHLRADIATAAPGRDNDRRHADPEAQRMAAAIGHRRIAIILGLALDGDGAEPVLLLDRRHGREHVVVEAARLVIIDDEHRLGEHLRMVDESLDQLGADVLALRWLGGRMFGEVGRRHDPGDLGQLARRDVGAEGLDELLAVRAFPVRPGPILRNPGPAAFVEVGILGAGTEGLEHREYIVPEVVVLLIDLPADPGVLQALGIGGPAIWPPSHRLVFGHVGAGGLVLAVVVHLRIAADLAAAIAAGPQMQPVGIGLGQGRTVVGVADRERARQGVVVGQVRGGVEHHPLVQFAARAPLVVAAPIDDGGRSLVALVGAVDSEGVGVLRIAMERHDIAVRMLAARLAPHRLAARQAHRPGVTKAANAIERAEIVIEGAVLLHVDHHMLDILDRARGVVGRDGHRLAHGARNDAQRGCRRQPAAGHPQEAAPVASHGPIPRS